MSGANLFTKLRQMDTITTVRKLMPQSYKTDQWHDCSDRAPAVLLHPRKNTKNACYVSISRITTQSPLGSDNEAYRQSELEAVMDVGGAVATNVAQQVYQCN
jgi:hypothetical protein